MARRPNTDRVFKAMARDTPDKKTIRIPRDQMLEIPAGLWADEYDYIKSVYLRDWVRRMRIKHGSNIGLDFTAEMDYHSGDVLLTGRVRGPWQNTTE